MILAAPWKPQRHLGQVVALLIASYQRYVSPHKGFGCPVRLRRGGLPCSEFAKRAVLRRGPIGAVPLVRRRFRLCAQTAKEKPTLHYEPLPVPPERKRTRRERAGDCASDSCTRFDAGCDAGDVVSCGAVDCCDCSPW